MHDARGRKAIERRTAGRGVRADVLSVDELPELHVGELLRQTDGVECVTGWSEDRTVLGRTFLEALQGILAVVKDHAAVRLIHTVIHVVAELATTDGFADDLRNSGRSGGDEKSAWLRENLDRLRKEAIEFRVQCVCQALE